MLLRTIKRWFTFLLLPALPLLLGACALQRTVDSTVQSYSAAENLAPSLTYRLAELPSQKAHPQEYAAVAPLVDAALSRAGLRRDDGSPSLIAEFTVRGESGYMQGPWYPEGPWGGAWGPGWRGGLGFGYGRGLRGGFLLRDLPPVVYRHEVHLVLRDATTQQTVYETSASNEDVWSQTPAVFGVLFEAALAGFPHPPAGPRQIRLPLVRSEAALPPAATPVLPSALPASPGR